jgi:hypothetical protein
MADVSVMAPAATAMNAKKKTRLNVKPPRTVADARYFDLDQCIQAKTYARSSERVVSAT